MARRQYLHGCTVAVIFAISFAMCLPASAQTQPAQLEQMNDRLDQATHQIESLKQQVRQLQAEQAKANHPQPATQPTATTAPIEQRELSTHPGKKQGMTAGYDGNHFFIASPDHDFKLDFEGQLQLRYVYNNRQKPTDNDQDVQGFQMRRAKIGVKGYIANPDLSFKVKGEFDHDGGTMALSDAWISYAFNPHWNIKAGVFDDVFLREFNVSSKFQQAAERSTVSRYFWDHSTKGILVSQERGRWRNFGQFTAGPDQAHTDFTQSSKAYEWAVTGRTEFLLAGKWKEFEDFADWMNNPLGVLAGAAISFDKGGNFPGSTRPDRLVYTADASAKLRNGIDLFGAFVGQHLNADPGQPAPGSDQFGFVAQAGAFVVPDKLDIFARYEYANLYGAALDNADNTVTAISDDKINLITIGTNYYFKEHRAKLTFDVVYSLSPLDADLSSTATGLLPDMDSGQIAVRSQLQFLF